MGASSIRFETLFERYHDEIYRYLWRLVGGLNGADSAVDAEDLVQEVFIRAYQAFPRLLPDSNYRAWLYKIATNCAYTALQRDHQRQKHEWLPPLESLAVREDRHDPRTPVVESPYHHAIFKEAVTALKQAIAHLPAKQQAALVMRYLQELEYSEIAEVLNCSEESARANVYQGTKRLRQDLGSQSPGS
ncbi:MAG: RNA polymerase sigma factor [Chloroflexi bacterium]|nr:RNA polymerase sigma factor [Chloroflexota bacterium]